ncbi:uncharacterized protein [Ptychodera flava]|uniref:uncharacterized protein n=1 Tax=Ptychodera flava TaxID=63121 RepID=UPI00396A4CED
MMSPLTAHCIYHGDKFRTEYGFVTRNLAKNKVVDSDKFHFLDSAVCCCPGSTNSKFAKITRRKLIQWAERTISNPVSNIHFLAPTLKHFVGLLSLKRGNTDEDKAIHAFLNCIRSLSNGFCSSFARIEPAASRRRTLANKPVEETTVPPPSNNLTTIATNDASLLKPSPSKPVEESTVPPPSYYSTTMATNNNASLLKPRPRLRVPLRIKRVGVRPCTFRRPFRSLPKRPKHGRRKKRPNLFQ